MVYLITTAIVSYLFIALGAGVRVTMKKELPRLDLTVAWICAFIWPVFVMFHVGTRLSDWMENYE